MPTAPLRIDAADLAPEHWDTPDRGRIGWTTLFSAGLTPTEALTCGVAVLPAGGSLAPHRHAQPEIYFGLEGAATVTIDGAAHALTPGVALFIPGHALHAVEGGPARYFYAFACDSFEDVAYDFGAAQPPG